MRYKGFISYSHRDQRWAQWLHRSLETYRVPKSLVGATGRTGAIPPKLGVFFRDREELPSSHDLGDVIAAALRESEYLIVICSPAAAQSRWVNQEIIEFKRAFGEDRVLGIVVAGEPNATDRGQPENECFPPALRHVVNPDGTIGERRVEPLAADAQPDGDGKANAKLKLIAGILGVRYDQLRQRERLRRRRQMLFTGVFATVLTAVVTTLLVGYVIKDRRAAAERASKEGMLASLTKGFTPTPFVKAVVLGDLDEALRNLPGEDINKQWGPEALTPLMLASVAGQEKMVDWLLTKGADVSAINTSKLSAVHLAAAYGSTKVLETFQGRGINLDVVAPHPALQRPIDSAAGAGQAAAIQKLIDLGVKVNIEPSAYKPQPAYRNPLFWAAYFGKDEAVRVLLNNNADKDAQGSQGTPADKAAQANHPETARLIREFGGASGTPSVGATKADTPGAKGGDLSQALVYAIMSGALSADRVATVERLIADGADVNRTVQIEKLSTSATEQAIRQACTFTQDKIGRSEQLRALEVDKHTSAILRAVLKAGADVNACKSMLGEPILFDVVRTGDESVLAPLLDAGVNVNVTNTAGKTPIDVANERCARLLLQRFPTLATKTTRNRPGGREKATTDPTAQLVTAVMRGPAFPAEAAKIDALLAAGADVNRKAPVGNFEATAIARAVQMACQYTNGAVEDAPGPKANPELVQRSISILKRVVEAAGDVNVCRSVSGDPLIFDALTNDSVIVLEILLDAKADLSAVNRAGQRATDFARDFRCPKCRAALARRGAATRE